MEALLKNSASAHTRDLEDALDAIRKARELHEQLIEETAATSTEKARLARDIANLLFTTEAGRNLPVHIRHSLTRLRADAEYRAGLSVHQSLRNPSEVWDHYERLQSAAA